MTVCIEIITFKTAFSVDLPSIGVMKSVESSDSNEINNEKIILNKSTLNEDQVMYNDCTLSEEHLNQNHGVSNAESYREQHVINESDETLMKPSSRPQRQAAKKAENQIRVNKHKLWLLVIITYDTKRTQLLYLLLFLYFRKLPKK